MIEQAAGARWHAGQRVRVRECLPVGHCRTPFYIRGKRGQIERGCGLFANPEELAYRRDGLPAVALYRVRFSQRELWQDYAGPAHDCVEVEIYEHWLEPDADGPAPSSPAAGGTPP